MTAPSPDRTADLIDLAGRIMLTHTIDPCHLMNLLGIAKLEAEAIIRTGETSVVVGDDWHDRLQLFVNISCGWSAACAITVGKSGGCWKIVLSLFTAAQRPMGLGVAWKIFGQFAMPLRR